MAKAAPAPVFSALDQRPFQVIVTALYLALAVALVVLSMTTAGGHLIYTLDDPYIHLALAETIVRGGYGVNVGEFASPSSSVLYPLIMAGTTIVGLGDWGPLVVGLLACGVAIWVLAGFVFRHAGGGLSPLRFWLLVLMTPLLMLAVNALALPMMGMEHGLHLLAVVVVVAGLAEMAAAGRTPPLLPIAIVLCALIRFEGLALALAAIAAMLACHQVRPALAALAVIAAALGVYTAVMSALGLPLLPSSVLVKSGASAALADGAGGALLGLVAGNAASALSYRPGMLLALGALIIGAALLAQAWRPASPLRRPALVVGVVALTAIVAHLMLGQFGQSRYEIYVMAIMIMAVVHVTAPLLRGGAPAVAALALFVGLVGIHYVSVTLRTPAASRNIYEQQYQMHRFATEFFPEPVAVNDLGWVAYRNDRLVLDLWGLGSEEARRLTRRDGRTVATLLRLTADRGIAYAMIYDEWFRGAVPPAWCSIAWLHTSQVTASHGEVAFYAIDPARRAALREALVAFAPTLPPGARLDLKPGTPVLQATGNHSATHGAGEGCENPADALQSAPG